MELYIENYILRNKRNNDIKKFMFMPISRHPRRIERCDKEIINTDKRRSYLRVKLKPTTVVTLYNS